MFSASGAGSETLGGFGGLGTASATKSGGAGNLGGLGGLALAAESNGGAGSPDIGLQFIGAAQAMSENQKAKPACLQQGNLMTSLLSRSLRKAAVR